MGRDEPRENEEQAKVTPLPAVSKLDPMAAFLGLNVADQRRLGAAAIALALGSLGERNGCYPRQGFLAADLMALEEIEAIVETNICRDLEPGAIPLPALGRLGIRSCRECGCVDACACEEGCSWVEADLCSACAERLQEYTVEVSHPDLNVPTLGVFRARTEAEAAANATRSALRHLIPGDQEELGSDERADLERESQLLLAHLADQAAQRVWRGRFDRPPRPHGQVFGRRSALCKPEGGLPVGAGRSAERAAR